MNVENIVIPSEEEGMPQAVESTKFAQGYEARVLAIFDKLPSQFSKVEKKYKLSSVAKGARFRDYENAFMWLAKAMVINNC